MEVKLCEYGCGQPAIHQFKNGKWCCSKCHVQCPNQREIRSSWIPWNKGKKGCFSVETLRKKSESSKGRTVWNKDKKNCYSKEALKKMSENSKGIEPWNKGIIMNLDPWNKGKKGIFSEESLNRIRKSCRLAAIKRIQAQADNGYQIYPNYNPTACKLIDQYGKRNGYNFKHAENGGEYYIKELGYWVDGYDAEKNTILEVDEASHFDKDGNLLERDIRRQNEITEFLGCDFIRLKI